jgi:hypothetical protein
MARPGALHAAGAERLPRDKTGPPRIPGLSQPVIGHGALHTAPRSSGVDPVPEFVEAEALTVMPSRQPWRADWVKTKIFSDPELTPEPTRPRRI